MSKNAKIVIGLRIQMDWDYYKGSGILPPRLNIPELDFGPFARLLEQRYHEKVTIRVADDYVDVVTASQLPQIDEFVTGPAQALGEVLLRNSSKPTKNHTIAVSSEWQQLVPMQPRHCAPPPAWLFLVVGASTELVAGSWVATLRMDFGEDLLGRFAGRPEPRIQMPRFIKEELERCLDVKLIDEAFATPIISPFG